MLRKFQNYNLRIYIYIYVPISPEKIKKFDFLWLICSNVCTIAGKINGTPEITSFNID